MTVKPLDIVNTEIERDLPHWLSTEGKTFHRLQEIRARNRSEYLATRGDIAESKKLKGLRQLIKERKIK
jgi:hypothetical protein